MSGELLLIIGDTATTTDEVGAYLSEHFPDLSIIKTGVDSSISHLLRYNPDGLILLADEDIPGAIALTKRIKKNPYTGKMPLFFVARLDQKSNEEAWAADADEVIDIEQLELELPMRLKRVLAHSEKVRELEDERRYYRCLLSSISRQATAEDYPQVLAAATEEAARMLLPDSADFMLVDPDRWRETIHASIDSPEPITREDVLIDKPLLTNYLTAVDVLQTCGEKEPKLVAEISRLLERDDRDCLCLIPIRHRTESFGLVILSKEKADEAFSSSEISFFMALADAIARTISLLRKTLTEKRKSTRTEGAFRRAQAELAEKEKYETFFEHASDAMMILNRKGKIIDVNITFSKITGYRREELFEFKYTDLVSDDSLSSARKMFENFLAGNHVSKFDITIRRRDGDERIVSCNTRLLPGLEAFILSGRDVTEQRQVSKRLEMMTNFLSKLIEASSDAIVAADSDGKIIVFNSVAENMTGYTREEAIAGLDIRDLYDENLAYDIMARLRSDEQGGYGMLQPMRLDVINKNSERIPVQLSAALLFDGREEIGSVGYFTDLRHQEKISRELKKTQQQLIESSKQAAVVELAGTTAHLLNQPLTTIIGYIQLLARDLGNADERKKRFLETITDEATRMSDIVKQIGKITRYQTKKYAGDKNIIDLSKSVDEEE